MLSVHYSTSTVSNDVRAAQLESQGGTIFSVKAQQHQEPKRNHALCFQISHREKDCTLDFPTCSVYTVHGSDKDFKIYNRPLKFIVWSVDRYQSGSTDRTGCEQKGLFSFSPVLSSIFTSSLTESHHLANLFPCHVANENDALLLYLAASRTECSVTILRGQSHKNRYVFRGVS